MKKSRINKTVLIQSILALICLILTYTTSYWFILPVAILILLNQRELFGKK